jgi:hypothetical protein
MCSVAVAASVAVEADGIFPMPPSVGGDERGGAGLRRRYGWFFRAARSTVMGDPIKAGSLVRLLACGQGIFFPIQPPPFLRT